MIKAVSDGRTPYFPWPNAADYLAFQFTFTYLMGRRKVFASRHSGSNQHGNQTCRVICRLGTNDDFHVLVE